MNIDGEYIMGECGGVRGTEVVGPRGELGRVRVVG